MSISGNFSFSKFSERIGFVLAAAHIVDRR